MTPDEHAAHAAAIAEAAAKAGNLAVNESPDKRAARVAEMHALAALAQVHATLSLRPPPTTVSFVPRHETLSAEDLSVPDDNPNADNDYSPGS